MMLSANTCPALPRHSLQKGGLRYACPMLLYDLRDYVIVISSPCTLLSDT